MADNPIQTDLAGLMNSTMDVLVDLLPKGVIVAFLVSVPNDLPGSVQLKPGGRTNYISNGHREDMASAMIEILTRWGKLP